MSTMLHVPLAFADRNKHAHLVSSLTTFYHLLADLGTFPHSAIITPPNDSGKYPIERINIEAAREAGFGTDALEVLYRIPYLDGTIRDTMLDYETIPLNYLDNESETAFDFARDPTYQDRTDLMLPHVVVLTYGRTGGTELIYNAKTCCVTAWNHFNDEEEWLDLPSYDMDDFQNPLYQWIISFLTLRSFHITQMHLVQPDPAGRWPDPAKPPNPNIPASEMREWEKLARRWRYEWTLREVFIAAGWNVDAAISALSDANGSPLWERLESARLAAKAMFDRKDFEQRMREWELTYHE